MVNHHIQKSIIYRLAFNDRSRFTDLKPDAIGNKLLDYHLKITISDGFVQKDEDGLYSLTPKGRRLGPRVYQDQLQNLDKADSVLFLILRRKSDQAWLLYKRLTHPLLNRVGFMHANPIALENSKDTATKFCLDNLGVKAKFDYLGAGYFRMFEDHKLESFTNFTLLVCEDAEGEITNNYEAAEYSWVEDPDFKASDMLPNMPKLVELYKKGKVFFVEQSFDL